MQYFDSHAHLEGLSQADLEKLGKSEVRVVAVSTDTKTHEFALGLREKGFPAIHKLLLGWHPDAIGKDTMPRIEEALELAVKGKADGFGEIGLDASKPNPELQKKVFERFMEAAVESRLPVSIHSRKAVDEVLEVVGRFKGVKGVLHWFYGTGKQLARALELGLFIGVTENTLNKDFFSGIPVERLLLETDSPVYGRTPLDIVKLHEKAAARIGVESIWLAEKQKENLDMLFLEG